MERYPELKGKAILFLLFLWFLWFINFSVRAVFSPILPLIEDEFVISHARASSIFMFQSMGYGVAMFLSGFYSGRFGYKKLIVLSLCISFFVSCLIPFVKAFSILYVANFFYGFSIGTYLPSGISLITEYFAERHWGKSLALHDSGSTISIFCTPFIALFLLHFVNWRWIFAVYAVIFLVAAIVFYLISDEVETRNPQNIKAVFGHIVKKQSVWAMGTLFTFAAGAALGLYFIVPLYLTKELSVSIEYANTILGISRLGGIAVALSSSFFIDRINLQKAMFIIMLITGILTVLIGIVPVRLIGVLLFLQSVCLTGFFPIGLLSIARMFSREIRGMATGFILTLSIIFGSGLIPYLLGFSGDYFGFGFGIVILGILLVLSSLLTFTLREHE